MAIIYVGAQSFGGESLSLNNRLAVCLSLATGYLRPERIPSSVTLSLSTDSYIKSHVMTLGHKKSGSCLMRPPLFPFVARNRCTSDNIK